MGYIISWPSPILEKLRQPDSPVHLTSYQEGWVVSATFFGQILSPIPSGFITHKLGPKRSLLFLSSIAIFSWILVYFSTSPEMLVTARLLAGFWLGAVMTIVPLYTSEISEPHVRGIFGCLLIFNMYFGANIAYIFGPYVTFQAMAFIGGLVSVLFLILFSFCPESPYFYVLQRDGESAMRSLCWLRGSASEQINLELELIQMSVEKEAKNGGSSVKELVTLMTVPGNRKAFVVVGIMNILEPLCGLDSLTAFSSVILPPLGPLTSDGCMMIVNVITVFPILLTMLIIHRVGRKPLLFYSSAGVCVSMFWTGVWHFLNSKTTFDISELNWLPLVGYIVYLVTFLFGLGIVVPIYQGELFPSNLKGLGSALLTMINALSATVNTALFPVFSENIGVYMNLFLFAAAGFASMLFTCFYVIETEGKSLQTIQAELNAENTEKIEIVGEFKRLLH